MNDLMLDLETMGAGPTAAITSIGGVLFDPVAGQLGSRFYVVVDLASSVAAGMVMDPSTVLWWLRQSDAARGEITGAAMPLVAALDALTYWLNVHSKPDDLSPWGNGAGFDNVILASAYALTGKPVPWKFFNNRCYRTLKRLRPDIELQRTGTHHHALHDAESQAQHAIAILQALQQPTEAAPALSAPKGWTRDNEATFVMLHLVGGHKVPRDAVTEWTDAQCLEAEQWAGALHLRASDNDNVIVPAMPAHVAEHAART